MKERTDFLWTEKWRPKKVEDCILPKNIKDTFSQFVKNGFFPNLLLAGPPGVGKTTIAKALCTEIGADYYVINGSDEGRFLDTVRNQAKNFASTMSLTSKAKHKVIIIDEADNTGNDVQLLLRANIEAFHKSCRFIFTCNYKNKIIEPLHSRCAVIDFSLKGKDKQYIAASFFKRLNHILDVEEIEADKKVLAEVVNKHFPDLRRVLNEVQRYSVTGKIDTGILSNFSEIKVSNLFLALKNKNFNDVKQWVVSNLDNDPSRIIRKVYDEIYSRVNDGPSICQAITILNKYDYQSKWAVDPEINLQAMFVELMVECEFK